MGAGGVSGYTDLARLAVVVRPYDDPPPSGDRYSPFQATIGQTVTLLAHELEFLAARNIVLQLGLKESDLRVDGFPRATARAAHDAVALSFESRHGPLRYETNSFVGDYREPGWQANLRAIALGMEALRRVDRYGISKRGEQYRGWRQLTTGTDPADSIATREQAVAFLNQWRGGMDWSMLDCVRAAVKATHPDAGGDADEFRKVMRARELVS